MWPYLERNLSACLADFSRSWKHLSQGGIPTPEKLIELTVETAWKSGRSYWMELAANWAIDMVRQEGFDQGTTRMLLLEMAASEALPPELRDRVRGVLAGR